MPVLKYMNPSDGTWVELSTVGPPGTPGAPGAVGPPGPIQVSGQADNVATTGSDGLIYVAMPDTGITQAEGDARYLKLSGGSMTGALSVQAPTSSGHAATMTYVDQMGASVPKVTVGTSAPSNPKVGDIWCNPS